MDAVLADTLTANLKSAKTSEQLAQAHTLALIALVDCQRKTAERVKELYASHERLNLVKRCISGFIAAGGCTILIKLLKVAGMI